MASLLDKVRTAILARAHQLVDLDIDSNSIEAHKVHIRDLEGALDQMGKSVAEAKGNFKSCERELAGKESEIAETNRNIDLLLGDDDPTNDMAAEDLQKTLINMESERDTQKIETDAARETKDALGASYKAIEQKHKKMVSELHGLEATDRATKAKEKAVATAKFASSITSTGADASVDNLKRKMQQRADTADAAFDDAFSKLKETTSDPVMDAKAKAAIAERKARLAAAKTTTA